MRNKVTYEWDIEVADENGDIIDHDHQDRLADYDKSTLIQAMRGEDGMALALVRDEWHRLDGVVDRQWAYFNDGELDACFSDNAEIPQKYRDEMESFAAAL